MTRRREFIGPILREQAQRLVEELEATLDTTTDDRCHLCSLRVQIRTHLAGCRGATERLYAENERLRDGIRQHRERVQERRFGYSEAADDDLWALLDDTRIPAPDRSVP